MRTQKIVLSICCTLFITISLILAGCDRTHSEGKQKEPSPAVTNSTETLSGQVIFAADYKRESMERKGYRFISEGTYGRFITLYYGAPGAAIIIKNSKGEIIGTGKTISDGSFTLNVESSKFYQIAVEFRGRKLEKTFSSPDAMKTIQLDVGRIDTMPEVEKDM
jgi:hypothetical protein